MTLLSVLFVVLTLTWLVFLPYLANDEDSRAGTQRLALGALYEALEQPDLQSALQASEVLSRVAAENPRFRYFVREGDRQGSYGGPPRWRHAVREARRLAAGGAGGTAYWNAAFEDGGVVGQASYQLANGRETYIEIAGVERAVEREALAANNWVAFWWASKNPLIAAAGVLAIALAVLLLALHSLRRLTRAVRAFDVGIGMRRLLAEDGLPAEVAPLVHACNEMVDRVEATHAQQELFLAAAAHELRTPLAVLRTRLEALAEGGVKEELRADLRRMSTLVEQVLRLMNIRNRRELAEDVELISAVREVVADRTPLALGRGVDVEMAADADALMVRGDRELLEVAVANLLDNAISFSRRGDVLTIHIDGDGRVSVRDGGPGVDEQEAERLFEPFAKSPPNREGHGLGLAVVKAIMGLHGGQVSVRNNEGQGATFSLRFQPRAA